MCYTFTFDSSSTKNINSCATLYNNLYNFNLPNMSLQQQQQQHEQTLEKPVEREKMSRQLLTEIFNKLSKFGTEPDRLLFSQRLQTIWEENWVHCQSYPTITNQTLDLYKLHKLVLEKQGYLEITTNRGWKDVATILGFGDSGSAAYSVKRNYVRLGLLAYECRFDRGGIDPQGVIELSEMPHTVKKRKRGNNNASSVSRTIAKANKQQLQMISSMKTLQQRQQVRQASENNTNNEVNHHSNNETSSFTTTTAGMESSDEKVIINKIIETPSTTSTTANDVSNETMMKERGVIITQEKASHQSIITNNVEQLRPIQQDLANAIAKLLIQQTNLQQLYPLSVTTNKSTLDKSTLTTSQLVIPNTVHNLLRLNQRIQTQRKLLLENMPINDIQRFSYTLRAGQSADSNHLLDTLNLWLSDEHTAMYFNLKTLPGLFNALIEQYLACLYELYEEDFLQPNSTNNLYMKWFLKSKLRLHNSAIGPTTNEKKLEQLFYGSKRYALKQLLTKKTVSYKKRQHNKITPYILYQLDDKPMTTINFIDNSDEFENNEQRLPFVFNNPPFSSDSPDCDNKPLCSPFIKNEVIEYEFLTQSLSSTSAPHVFIKRLGQKPGVNGRARARAATTATNSRMRSIDFNRRTSSPSWSFRSSFCPLFTHPLKMNQSPTSKSNDTDSDNSSVFNETSTSHHLPWNDRLSHNVQITDESVNEEVDHDDNEDELNNNSHNNFDRIHSIMTRCTCISTIIRNLTFIDENEHYLANDKRLIDILERILILQHQQLHEKYEIENEQIQFESCYMCTINLNKINSRNDLDEAEQDDNERTFNWAQSDSNTSSIDYFETFYKPSTLSTTCAEPLSCVNDCHQLQLMTILDHSFVTLSSLANLIELRLCQIPTRQRLINTICHWILCSLSLTDELFIQMLNDNNEPIYISPREVSIQILAKLCTNESNVDLILSDLSMKQLKSLGHHILSNMTQFSLSKLTPTDFEYSLIILCSLCKRSRQLSNFFGSHPSCIDLLINYMEQYEYYQQQLIITTPCTPLLINQSLDMMIDTCISCLTLLASINKSRIYFLRYEIRLLDLSYSIYFDNRLQKALADILYIIKS
ncbi:unnamed protein product [Didymodactylos carnosus]|uniref:ARID domain-containing protein n=1 Tax=Didymodactylos carnosus TaxID=1234261 RepID=A0A8S2CSP5_9BILA|nr:unnamed protein product [Didymodactylos carnosus]CAF3507199.1 unnamed protein product [Didymodactylos carnosus]